MSDLTYIPFSVRAAEIEYYGPSLLSRLGLPEFQHELNAAMSEALDTIYRGYRLSHKCWRNHIK